MKNSGCAKKLFVTKPKPAVTQEACQQVRDVASIRNVALTLESEKGNQEVRVDVIE